jgi:lambda repressor-like predicted transcriptional regulator
MSELEKIKEFFTDMRKRCLSVRRLEAYAGLPAKTLDNFLAGRRSLSASAVEKIIPVLEEFGYKSI